LPLNHGLSRFGLGEKIGGHPGRRSLAPGAAPFTLFRNENLPPHLDISVSGRDQWPWHGAGTLLSHVLRLQHAGHPPQVPRLHWRPPSAEGARVPVTIWPFNPSRW